MTKSGWLKTAFTVALIPIGLEIVSELAFTFTDVGSDFLIGLAEYLGLEGGIHGSASGGELSGELAHEGHDHGSHDPEHGIS